VSGRIRTVKPELLEDAVTAGLSDRAFRLFIAVILMADDYGRLRAESRFIAGQVYWLRECSQADMAAALAEIEPLVLFYDIHGQRYAEIRNWNKHQKVSHPGKPRIPPPPEELSKPSGGPPETLRPDLGSWILDLGSPTPTPTPGGEVKRDPPERRFSTGTSGFAAKAAYETAMAKATGRPFGFPARTIGDLCELLNEHARDELTRAAALLWLERALAEWVAKADPKYTAGWSPPRLNAWLNEGRPSANGRRESPPDPTTQLLTHAELVARGML